MGIYSIHNLCFVDLMTGSGPTCRFCVLARLRYSFRTTSTFRVSYRPPSEGGTAGLEVSASLAPHHGLLFAFTFLSGLNLYMWFRTDSTSTTMVICDSPLAKDSPDASAHSTILEGPMAEPSGAWCSPEDAIGETDGAIRAYYRSVYFV